MTKDKQQQIDFLNSLVKVKLAPSPIHGIGVFALRDIAQGEKLYADFAPTVFTLTFAEMKKLLPEVREKLLEQWPQIVNGSRFAYPTTRIQAFINHDEHPNYDAFGDSMLTSVHAGEEITEDYRLIKSYQQVFPWLA